MVEQRSNGGGTSQPPASSRNGIGANENSVGALKAPMDPREIVINISDTSSTFRTFLLEKKDIKNMKVKPVVRLYSEKGFTIDQNITTTPAYAAFSKIFDGASGIRDKAIIGKIVAGGVKAAKFAKAGAIVSSAGDDGVAWTPWLKNVLAFKDAPAFDVSLTLKFKMGQFGLWDAKEEVYKPIMNLMGMFLPLSITGINVVPHLRTSTQTMYDFMRVMMNDLLTSSGASILSDMKDAGKSVVEGSKDGGVAGGLSAASDALDDLFKKLSTGLGSIVVETIENKVVPYTVDIGYASGKFTLRRMQPLKCNIEFTNKEYDSNGYPIEGQIIMSFSSFQPATVAGIQENRINFGFMR